MDKAVDNDFLDIIIIAVSVAVGVWLGYQLGPSLFGMHIPFKDLLSAPRTGFLGEVTSEAQDDVLIGGFLGLLVGLVIARTRSR